MENPEPTFSSKILRLIANHMTPRLLTELRRPGDADHRAQAAQALGLLGDLDATESLIRACREDPSPEVQAAARQALRQLLGNKDELALSTYREPEEQDDPWLAEPAEPDQEPAEDVIAASDLEGLISIARYEPDPKLRLRAIDLLGRSSDMRATETLAELTLQGREGLLRAAAREALLQRYGEQAEAIIASYRLSGEPAEVDEEDLDEETGDEEDFAEDDEWEDEEEDEDDDEDEYENEDGHASPYLNQRGDPVMQEMGFPWKTMLWFILIFGAALAAIAIIAVIGGGR